MKRALREGGQEAAKAMLAMRLAPVHDSLGWRVTIVYDGRGEEIDVQKIGRSVDFSEVYSPASMTADELIEQLCATSKAPSDITIASCDNLLRLTATSLGASSLSAAALLEFAAGSGKDLSRKTAEISREAEIGWRGRPEFQQLDKLKLAKKTKKGSR